MCVARRWRDATKLHRTFFGSAFFFVLSDRASLAAAAAALTTWRTRSRASAAHAARTSRTWTHRRALSRACDVASVGAVTTLLPRATVCRPPLPRGSSLLVVRCAAPRGRGWVARTRAPRCAGRRRRMKTYVRRRRRPAHARVAILHPGPLMCARALTPARAAARSRAWRSTR